MNDIKTGRDGSVNGSFEPPMARIHATDSSELSPGGTDSLNYSDNEHNENNQMLDWLEPVDIANSSQQEVKTMERSLVLTPGSKLPKPLTLPSPGLSPIVSGMISEQESSHTTPTAQDSVNEYHSKRLESASGAPVTPLRQHEECTSAASSSLHNEVSSSCLRKVSLIHTPSRDVENFDNSQYRSVESTPTHSIISAMSLLPETSLQQKVENYSPRPKLSDTPIRSILKQSNNRDRHGVISAETSPREMSLPASSYHQHRLDTSGKIVDELFGSKSNRQQNGTPTTFNERIADFLQPSIGALYSLSINSHGSPVFVPVLSENEEMLFGRPAAEKNVNTSGSGTSGSDSSERHHAETRSANKDRSTCAASRMNESTLEYVSFARSTEASEFLSHSKGDGYYSKVVGDGESRRNVNGSYLYHTRFSGRAVLGHGKPPHIRSEAQLDKILQQEGCFQRVYSDYYGLKEKRYHTNSTSNNQQDGHMASFMAWNALNDVLAMDLRSSYPAVSSMLPKPRTMGYSVLNKRTLENSTSNLKLQNSVERVHDKRYSSASYNVSERGHPLFAPVFLSHHHKHGDRKGNQSITSFSEASLVLNNRESTSAASYLETRWNPRAVYEEGNPAISVVSHNTTRQTEISPSKIWKDRLSKRALYSANIEVDVPSQSYASK